MSHVTSSMGVVIWKLSHQVAAGPSNKCAANLTFSASVQPTVTKSLFTERSQSLATIGSIVPENFVGLNLKNLVSMSKPGGVVVVVIVVIVVVVVVVVVLVLDERLHHLHQLSLSCHHLLHLWSDVVVVGVGIGTTGRHLWFVQ